MKLFTIAHNIPPNMIRLENLITIVKAQLHRLLPAAYDRMISHYEHEEEKPGVAREPYELSKPWL